MHTTPKPKQDVVTDLMHRIKYLELYLQYPQETNWDSSITYDRIIRSCLDIIEVAVQAKVEIEVSLKLRQVI